MIRHCGALLLLALLLAACTTNPLRSPRDEWPEIGNEFAKSLRWSGAELAATFFTSSARANFLTAYGDVGGMLQITNVRHDVGAPPVGSRAQGLLAIEYYRSPSISVKTVNIPLEWSCVEAGTLQPCRWQISTLMTRLP